MGFLIMELKYQNLESNKEKLNSSNNEIHNLKLNWYENLENVNNHLNQILALSDEQFVSISENLQYFYSEVKDVSKNALEVTNLLSGDDYNASIQELESISDFINNYISGTNNKFQESENSFTKIIKFLENIVDDSQAFKKLVKHLDAQGISIKIESARLGNDDKGFKVIAENINNLSIVISNKSQGFKERTKFLIDIIKKAQGEIINLQKDQQEHSNSILRNTKTSLQSLIEKNVMSSAEVDAVHIKSENIKQEVSSLVTAIQFHDITRQQIEHVNNVILKLTEKINLIKENDDPEENKKLIVYIHEAARLQSAQLNNSKNELNNAAYDIISNLEGIQKDVAGISTEILGMMESTGNESETFIGKVDKGYKDVLLSLDKNKIIGDEFSKAINNVATTINDLSTFINEISDIGSEIELISLNASIKAAHTGSEGAALGVLAEATQKLSVQSKNDTDSVIKMLVSVWEISQQLQKNSDNNYYGHEQKHLESVSSNIEKIFKSLLLFSEKAKDYLKIIRQNSIKIGKDIEHSILSIRTYLEIDEKINEVIFELNDIINQSEIQIDGQRIDKNELEDLSKDYTMQRQRNIHKSIYSGNIQNNFHNNPDTEFQKDKSSLSEFGDNVDLF